MTNQQSVGIDEVGRGAWAGPLVAAAVSLEMPLPGLNDSKLLRQPQRQFLAEQIRQHAKFIGIGQASPTEIDRLGLTAATSLAMGRAIKGAKFKLIVIDGPINYLPNQRGSKPLINADALIPAVMAASIIAKVERDQLMRQLSSRYTGYGFEKHVGYGTAAHKAALTKLGPCRLHRLSFRPVMATI